MNKRVKSLEDCLFLRNLNSEYNVFEVKLLKVEIDNILQYRLESLRLSHTFTIKSAFIPPDIFEPFYLPILNQIIHHYYPDLQIVEITPEHITLHDPKLDMNLLVSNYFQLFYDEYKYHFLDRDQEIIDLFAKSCKKPESLKYNFKLQVDSNATSVAINQITKRVGFFLAATRGFYFHQKGHPGMFILTRHIPLRMASRVNRYYFFLQAKYLHDIHARNNGYQPLPNEIWKRIVLVYNKRLY